MAKRKSGDRRRKPGFSSCPRKPLIEVKGRLGKVQKSKKHKGIRPISSSSTDFYEAPVSERAPFRKENANINATPRNTDQEMPYKVKAIKKFRSEGGKKGSQKKKMDSRSQSDDTESGRRQKNWHTMPEPVFKKLPQESNRTFFNRVEREAQAALTKSKLENKYKVTFTEDGGIIKAKKKTKRKLKSTRFHQEKKEQQVLKKEERTRGDDGFAKFKDTVPFGEVVHAPPQLKAKPRNASTKPTMASKVQGLKLMSLLRSEEHEDATSAVPYKLKITRTPAQQLRLEAERERVIALYRQMKAKKLLGQSAETSSSAARSVTDHSS